MKLFLNKGQRYRDEFARSPEHFLARVVRNYIETGRSIRDLADYYGIPKSTLHTWLKKTTDYLPYSLHCEYLKAVEMHKRAQCMRSKGIIEYIKLDIDGPMD